MTDDQLLRYSRHILLDALGIEGQTRLLAAHALVIGAGGAVMAMAWFQPRPHQRWLVFEEVLGEFAAQIIIVIDDE